MQLQSRSYNPGPIFRPRPFVLNREESSLMVIVTSWTTMTEAERIAQMIAEQVEQTNDDESTRVGDKSKAAPLEYKNDLHRALLVAAQNIYKQDNQKQARLLVEALVIQVQGQSVMWAQVGQPNLYLLRDKRLASLVTQADHSVLNPTLPPLPMMGLGLDVTTTVQAGSTRCQPNDQFVILAQTWEPSWPTWKETPSFQQINAHLIEGQSDLPFWSGLISL